MNTDDPISDFVTPDPADHDAERVVLGAMMLSEAQARACAAALDAGDFGVPAHQVVFRVLAHAVRAGEPTDPVATAAALEAAGLLRAGLDRPYLHTLYASVPVASNGEHYARIVRRKAVQRRNLFAARRVMQWARDEAEDANGLTERAIREFEGVRASAIGDDLTARTIGEFLADTDDDYDWVVPGLLERGDRLVITGQEGAGKSELFRMMAVCVAAGVHPFTWESIEPQRVLLLDCENSDRHTRRKIRPLVTQARLQHRPVHDENLWIECRPAGIDLALDKDISWLLRQVAAIKPAITFLGPLYRLAPRALNDDTDAAPVIAALNMVRARDCAVVLEAHAGHATGPGGLRDLRPRGSSAFLGWPEFGYGLRWADQRDKESPQRLVEMVSWRGDRDEREWPEMLASGGVWPWRPEKRTPFTADPGGWAA